MSFTHFWMFLHREACIAFELLSFLFKDSGKNLFYGDAQLRLYSASVSKD
ncbi:unnamed protein product [Brassica rapa subsp. narinosa]